MKKMKKFLSLGLAMMLALSMTTTAFAADTVTTVNIVIDDTDSITEAEYAAYRLLEATSLGIPEGETEEQFSYSIHAKYRDILEDVTKKETDEEIIKYIDDLSSEGIREFADNVYKAITAADPEIEADATTDDNTFDNVAHGYYLIAETVLGKVDGKDEPTDSYSLVMLDTVATNAGGNVTIKTKEDIPTVDKKVKEVNDSTGETSWGESADHDVNDVIEYQIRGTVSSEYDEYIIYNYQFVDTMDKSLTLDKSSIRVIVGGNEDDNGIYQDGGEDVTELFTKDFTTTEDEATRFKLKANLKEIEAIENIEITENTKIYVLYNATLNADALHGKPGNKNDVYLNYSNNPYVDSEGEPGGKTPVDTNIVFTFHTLVNKVDEKEEALAGAEFTLYKYNKFVEGDDKWVAVETPVIVNEEGTQFDFKGLDCGEYKLVETKVPAGYNKAADIIFEVVATYDDTVDPVALTALEVKDAEGNTISGDTKTSVFHTTLSEGKVETAVENLPGVVLPSTGGMGTTLFYVLGAVLVLGSVILIVTKKRMGE